MLTDRIEKLLIDFEQFNNWEDKYKHLISMGKKLPIMDDSYKTDANKIKGCQSQVWLFPELVEGKILFHADSDASIVKGIISLLLEVYNDATAEEILATRPTFLKDLGLSEHLSMSRANGLNAMIKQISMYALAIKTKLQMNL